MGDATIRLHQVNYRPYGRTGLTYRTIAWVVPPKGTEPHAVLTPSTRVMAAQRNPASSRAIPTTATGERALPSRRYGRSPSSAPKRGSKVGVDIHLISANIPLSTGEVDNQNDHFTSVLTQNQGDLSRSSLTSRVLKNTLLAQAVQKGPDARRRATKLTPQMGLFQQPARSLSPGSPTLWNEVYEKGGRLWLSIC